MENNLENLTIGVFAKAAGVTRVRQFIGKNRQFRNVAPAFIGVSAPIF